MAAPAQGKRSWFWAQGLGCGVLVATAAPLAVVLGVLFAPALLAAIMVPPQVATRRFTIFWRWWTRCGSVGRESAALRRRRSRKA